MEVDAHFKRREWKRLEVGQASQEVENGHRTQDPIYQRLSEAALCDPGPKSRYFRSMK